MTDIAIIGAGPAGLAAGIYAARAGVSVTIFEKNVHGGQITLTSEIDNYPGMQKTDGVELAQSLYAHATSLGVQIIYEEVTELELEDGIKKITTAANVYEARSVIATGGAVRRRLGCPGEAKFTGRGVSYCATCDAAFYRGKTVAIVGGGNTALEDAMFLSNHCEKVYLIHRRNEFRGTKQKQEAVRSRQNIELVLSANVASIEGDSKVHSCVVNTENGTKTLDIDGIFIAIGLDADTALYRDILPMDEDGYILAEEDCATPIQGVFAAGDLRQKPLRQVITAVSDGAVAAVAAAEYCNMLDEGCPV